MRLVDHHRHAHPVQRERRGRPGDAGADDVHQPGAGPADRHAAEASDGYPARLNRSACTWRRGTRSSRRLRSTASVMAGGPHT